MKVPLNELTEAHVSHISLVDRGANREPFRIVKREEDGQMLDFSNGIPGLFRKTEDRKPAIVAVAFAKQFHPEAAVEILGEAGLEFGDVQETDAANIYPIDGATPEVIEKAHLLKINDEVGFAVDFAGAVPERVAKGYVGYDFESTDFKTVVGTNKSMPMMAVAMSGLQDVVWNIMSNSDTVEVAKGDIKKALKDFSGMVLEIVDNIPATAFKLEAAVSKAATVKKTEDGGQGTDTNVKKDEEKPEEKPATEAGADAGDGDEKPGEGEEGDGKPPEAEAGEGKTETKKGEEAPAPKPAEAPAVDVAALAAAVAKSLEPQLADVKSQVASIGETVKEQGKSLKAAQASLKKLDDDLDLGIVGGDQDEEDEDGDGAETIHKVALSGDETANDEGFMVIDTAHQDPFPEFRGKGVQVQ
jgi:hypothetical protein